MTARVSLPVFTSPGRAGGDELCLAPCQCLEIEAAGSRRGFVDRAIDRRDDQERRFRMTVADGVEKTVYRRPEGPQAHQVRIDQVDAELDADHIGRRIKIHHLDDAQIIEGRNHGSEHTHHGQSPEPTLHRSKKHIKLPEEPRERRNAGHGEHENRHPHRHGGVGLAKPGQIFNARNRLTLPTHGDQHSKGAKVHGQINRHVNRKPMQAFITRDRKAH